MLAGELPTETRALARALIGCTLVRCDDDGLVAGRIVETEAYPPGDPASHAYIGERPRTAAMFGPPLHAYIYRIYGMYWCFNVSSEPSGIGAGVLVRALEPLIGIELMRSRARGAALRDLCRGPGRLARALALDGSLDGRALLADGELLLARPTAPPPRIGTSPRIGIRHAPERRLRYYARGCAYVSGPRSLSQ